MLVPLLRPIGMSRARFDYFVLQLVDAALGSPTPTCPISASGLLCTVWIHFLTLSRSVVVSEARTSGLELLNISVTGDDDHLKLKSVESTTLKCKNI